jgi:hypothetical protein
VENGGIPFFLVPIDRLKGSPFLAGKLEMCKLYPINYLSLASAPRGISMALGLQYLVQTEFMILHFALTEHFQR